MPSPPGSIQQSETLFFFDRTADDWRRNAEGKPAQVNVIAQRNRCVHHIQEAHPHARSILDVGCGTGELVVEMAKKGLQATGVDFAPEMIRACEELRTRLGVRAQFTCCSIFDHEAADESQDLVSALGFIEYISAAQLTELLRLARRILRPDGILALGSRNRLFNLFSLNEYTQIEMNLGTMDALLREAIAIGRAENCETFLRNAVVAPTLPQPENHPNTGIGVSVRYQYTPAELASVLRATGFDPIVVYPVHYHAMPPSVAKRLPEAHVTFANWAFELQDHRLTPSSSSFVIGARKN
jgi:2-polyprenyl-3-methyl-5-hydroxy-6-metoxy-1,4-benzoquinol methylase